MVVALVVPLAVVLVGTTGPATGVVVVVVAAAVVVVVVVVGVVSVVVVVLGGGVSARTTAANAPAASMAMRTGTRRFTCLFYPRERCVDRR